jgi:glycerol-3-phosphate dehydrogenase
MDGPFDRDQLLARARDEGGTWDVIVIGGGATGVGIAVDAAARGYRTLLLEQHDFGKGTSSRSTKLIHGGVRYLRQGNVRLVRSALHERGRLRANAPHLVRPLPFLVPAFSWWERAYYRSGLKVYDLLAGRWNLHASYGLAAGQAQEAIPGLRSDGLRGGVIYYDAQFDDARLVVNLVQTAIEHGAVCLNYIRVRELLKESGRVVGVVGEDVESGAELRATARVVINATGPFVDALCRQDDPHEVPLIAPSQGIHLVVDGSFLGGQTALMVPKTPDGRVIFAIPWYGRTVIGTTDTPVDDAAFEPRPHEAEIDYLLELAARYLIKAPQRSDVLSVFAGIRPLVRANDERNTSRLARDHTIVVSASGLVTITGGKWTTCREMAEDCVDRATEVGGLEERTCRTMELRVHGATAVEDRNDGDYGPYGSDAAPLNALVCGEPRFQERLHSRLPYSAGQVIWSARHELARTVEDVLSRRTRALLLDARAAVEVAPLTASLLAEELGRDESWQAKQVAAFRELAAGYLLGTGGNWNTNERTETSMTKK